MLHLAQVQKRSATGGIKLELLATQTDASHWAIDKRGVLVADLEALTAVPLLGEGTLILVEIDESGQFSRAEAATDWVLSLVQRASAETQSPRDLLREEEEQIEQWRQELTLQSQDITRRNLEIETRREQIEALEDSLKLEKEKLEVLEMSLQQEKAELAQHPQDGNE
ncbi:MAG: hypothetical protein HC838_01335 [Spirulinaceae cyanobacterium RM2_2_10]|nr:hypothetical protein [Spirulinaceae cyanobacterium SM2_1_0]NJO18975.1 hypothetical protein [Spirulinaceae cyanobacterium RM2_2_10]